MLPVIMGRQKTSPLPNNLLIIGGGTNPKVNIYNRDNLELLTLQDAQAVTGNNFSYNSNYIFVSGSGSPVPHSRKINRVTRAVSAIAANVPLPMPSAGQKLIADEDDVYLLSGYVYNAANALYKVNIASGASTSVLQSSARLSGLLETGDYLYYAFYTGSGSASVKKVQKSDLSIVGSEAITNTVSAYSACSDGVLLYYIATAGSYYVLDLDLNIQSGFTKPPSFNCGIAVDENNVYFGGTTGNLHMISKATQNTTTINLGTTEPITGLSLLAGTTELYVVTTTMVFRVPLDNPTDFNLLLSGFTAISNILVM